MSPPANQRAERTWCDVHREWIVAPLHAALDGAARRHYHQNERAAAGALHTATLRR